MLIGYARVSTTDQSLDIQLEALKAGGCEQIFAEQLSGSTTKGRMELQRALVAVREGDVLVITRLDRLARSMGDLINIVKQLEEKGVGLRCLQQAAIDTTNAQGRLMLNIMGAFAEFENALRRERQMEGIAKAKAAGVYSRPRNKRIAPDEVVALRAEGLGAGEIAKRLGVSRKTVYAYSQGMWGPSPFEEAPS